MLSLEIAEINIGELRKVAITQKTALDSLIEAALSDKSFAGIACGVWKDGVPVYKRYAGFAVPDTSPVCADTMFDLASLTKPLATAPLVMMARDEGMLELEKTVGNYLPHIHQDTAPIPLISLLLHLSGLPAIPALQTEFPDASNFSKEKACTKLFRLKPDPALFGKVLYSCTNYILLGLILEKIYGMTIGQLFKCKIADRLGLEHCGFAPGMLKNGEPQVLEKAAATEYCPWRKRRICGQVHDESSFCLAGQAGNAGLFANLDDTASIGDQFLRHGGKPLLSRASHMLMTSVQTGNLAERRSCGFRFHDATTADGPLWPHDSFGHTGFTGTSIFFAPRQDLMTVILTNRVYHGRDTTLDKIVHFRKDFHSLVWGLWGEEAL